MKILIVDDELAARKKLRSFLAEEGLTEIIEAENGEAAVRQIDSAHPDLVFLDIQMPKMTGFEVIDAIGADAMPPVVFVTAYDQYALDAFDVQAADYLLKPFDQERFTRSLKRAIAHTRTRGRSGATFDSLLAELRKTGGYLQRFTIKEGARFFFIPVGEVVYITSEEKYVEVHTLTRKALVRTTMALLEERLDPGKFVRIHRSILLNLDHLREIQPWSHGDCIAIMKDGKQLTVSRRYRERLLKI
jgi:two-component system, LytTR family, response regulator